MGWMKTHDQYTTRLSAIMGLAYAHWRHTTHTQPITRTRNYGLFLPGRLFHDRIKRIFVGCSWTSQPNISTGVRLACCCIPPVDFILISLDMYLYSARQKLLWKYEWQMVGRPYSANNFYKRRSLRVMIYNHSFKASQYCKIVPDKNDCPSGSLVKHWNWWIYLYPFECFIKLLLSACMTFLFSMRVFIYSIMCIASR